MPDTNPAIDRSEAELKAAIAESDADPRTVPHETVRAWLLRLADGQPPEVSSPEPE